MSAPVITQDSLDELVSALQITLPGVWTNVTLTTSTIHLDGASNTWVWTSGAVTTSNMAYFLIGNTMCLNFYLHFTTTLPTGQGTIYIAIPGSFFASAQSDPRHSLAFLRATDGSAVLSDVYAQVMPTASNTNKRATTHLAVTRAGGANFVAGETTLAGQIFFELQPQVNA